MEFIPKMQGWFNIKKLFNATYDITVLRKKLYKFMQKNHLIKSNNNVKLKTKNKKTPFSKRVIRRECSHLDVYKENLHLTHI